MAELNVTYFGDTDVGRLRENNEDVFIAMPIWDKSHFLFAAIDGMGGEEGGEVAADIAKRSIINFVTEFSAENSLTAIKRAMADANNAIVSHKKATQRFQNMGCVATAALLDVKAQTLAVAHVGDSRLYRYANGSLVKLTHDHSLVGYQEEQGILTEEAAMRHPRRSIIERCLGSDMHLAEDEHFIEGGIFPLLAGETFLFCSDGLSDVLTSNEISEVLSHNLNSEDTCKTLISKANESGGKDNITVVIVKTETTNTDVEEEKVVATENLDSETGSIDISEESSLGAKTYKESDRISQRQPWFYGGMILCLFFGFAIGYYCGINKLSSYTNSPDSSSNKLSTVTDSTTIRKDTTKEFTENAQDSLLLMTSATEDTSNNG